MRAVAKLLHFPLAGVNRALSVRDGTQPLEDRQYAAPFAMNVRGTGPLKDRRRGGSRPSVLPLKEASLSMEAIFRGRLYKPDPANASAWIASRLGDYEDFDFGADKDDVTRPVAGNVAYANMAGEDITAMFALGDRALIVATAGSLWSLQGEPTNGNMLLISPVAGCVSRDAWAWDGVRCYVLSANGVYAFAQGETPMRISDSIPQELKGCTSAEMSWDAEYEALHVVSDKGCWTLEIATKAWWPFDVSSTDSHVAIGPFRTSGRDDEDGMIDTLSVTIAQGSSNVGVAVYSGRTPEEALSAAENNTGAWSCEVGAGFNAVVRPRKRGAWCVVVLSSSGAWAFESATATVKQLGRLRP